MKLTINIDYGNLIFSKRHELDKQAYSKYYDSCFKHEINNLGLTFYKWYGDSCFKFEPIHNSDLYTTTLEKAPLTFNKWYGTESHKKNIIPLLRKLKLEKIQKLNEIDD